MRRKSLQGSVCAVARALDVIGDWWSLLIIYEAIAGPKRFGQLERNLGYREEHSRNTAQGAFGRGYR
jgi:DNA-binding HxlR family transcriptional regulator